MAYYLNSTTNQGGVRLTSTVTVGANIGDYFEFSGEAYAGNAGNKYRLVGIQSGYDSLLELQASRLLFRPSSSSSTTFNTNYTQPSVGEVFTVRVVRLAGDDWECLLNGASIGVENNPFNFEFNHLLRFVDTNDESFLGKFFYAIASTDGGASVTNNWNPSATNGTGQILPDEAGGIDGTLNGFPNDDSQWVFYDDGSGVNATADFDISAPQFIGAASVISQQPLFNVIRGSSIITGGATTLTLQNGVDYTLSNTDDTKWLFRITNNHHTGMGSTSGGTQNIDDFTAWITQSGADVTLNRFGSANNDRVDWEIIEFVGPANSTNEWVVREKGLISNAVNSAVDQTTTTALPGSVLSSSKVMVLCTGQAASDAGRNGSNRGLYTTHVNATDWDAIRGFGGSNGRMSYAVIEFTGSNWTVTQEEFTQQGTTGGYSQSLVTPVADTSKTFIHPQYRISQNATQGLDDSSVRVYLSSTTQFNVDTTTAANPSLKNHKVYVIQNPEINVNRYTGVMAGVGKEEVFNVTVADVGDLSNASVWGMSANSTGSGTAFPRGYLNFTLTTTTNLLMRQSDDGQTSDYAFETVEYPTGQTQPPIVGISAFELSAPLFDATGGPVPSAPEGVAAFDITAPTFNAFAIATLPQPVGLAAFDVAAPEFDASGSATLPNPVGSVGFDVSAPTFNASGGATTPNPQGSADFDISAPEFVGFGFATLPIPIGSLAFDVSAPTFLAAGTASLPQPSGDVEFDISPPQFQGFGEVIAQPIGVVSFDISAPEFQGFGSATIPPVEAVASFDIAPPQFNASGQSTLPQPIGLASFDIVAPTFSATGSATLPQPQANGDVSISAPLFDGIATILGFTFGFADDAITIINANSNIESIDATNNIEKVTAQSNIKVIKSSQNVTKIQFGANITIIPYDRGF